MTAATLRSSATVVALSILVASSGGDDRLAERLRMVETQISSRDVASSRVVEVMRQVPRHRFVPASRQASAYEDMPLPIGEGQTISQPYIVAKMTELAHIDSGDRVFELGTGSGYQAAVASRLASEVFTMEIHPSLAEHARATIADLGYRNVTVREGDGYYGWAEHAPFDAILVTAAATHIPPPLVEQLRPGGRMVVPVGPPFAVQRLMLVEKSAQGQIRTRALFAVRFVPVEGGHGGG